MRAFDLIQVEGHINSEERFIINDNDKITLIEIKSTKKRLEDNPYGFFLAQLKMNFPLQKSLGITISFVCLHPETKSYASLTTDELHAIVKNKRVQYEINLQNNLP